MPRQRIAETDIGSGLAFPTLFIATVTSPPCFISIFPCSIFVRGTNMQSTCFLPTCCSWISFTSRSCRYGPPWQKEALVPGGHALAPGDLGVALAALRAWLKFHVEVGRRDGPECRIVADCRCSRAWSI